ncbi:MAG: NUDIX hydrolase [SAR202 cluster bacterium Io17-Chloro-G9]|nr:MAG: NUDIX hydrolase [SAR202 cluster bacterium Io17-Chloro-G9]
MSELIQGERVARGATLRPGASALIFDQGRERVLLTRRVDNGLWCLPGGGMDAGESAEETCIRETLEETGLKVRVTKLVGVYTSPDITIQYAEGNRTQPVTFSFEAEIIGGELGLSEETTAFGYFPVDQLDTVDLWAHQRQRIVDAVENRQAAFFR